MSPPLKSGVQMSFEEPAALAAFQLLGTQLRVSLSAPFPFQCWEAAGTT